MGMSISSSRAASVMMSQPVDLRPAPQPSVQGNGSKVSGQASQPAAILDKMIGSLLDTRA